MDSNDAAERSDRTERFRQTAAGASKLAARLEDDPSTMAWVLAQYRAAEDKDDRLMAQQLEIDTFRLPHLALCKRPREDLFRADIDSIAEHIGMDPGPLLHVVRRVGTLEAFGQLHHGQAGRLLAAARDRAAEDPGEYDAAPDDSAQPGEDDTDETPR